MPYWVALALVALVLLLSKLRSVHLIFEDDGEETRRRLKKGGGRRQLKR
jgi:hypothetical protein